MLSFSQCRPEDSTVEVLKNNGSPLFFDSSRSLMKSESSFYLTLCGSAGVTFRKNLGSLEVDGCRALYSSTVR